MPELPEVETIRRSLAPLLQGRRVERVDVRCGRLRRPLPADFATRLEGRRLLRTWRRAKYLIVDLDDGRSWILHFGMSGRLIHHDAAQADGRHDHVRVRLSDGSSLTFSDPRRFGLMTVEDAAVCSLLQGIGPEPMGPHYSAPYLAALRRKTTRTLKDVLMDQRVVAGLGNIYVNEILFVAGLRPRRRFANVSALACERIVAATREVLGDAIEHKGSSVADFLDGIGRRGGYQLRHRVYDRAGLPCPCCSTRIRMVVVGQRSSYYCPSCQR